MLKKKLRAPLGAQYAYKHFANHKHFSIRIRENKLFHNRFAVIAGKNVDKKAVARNRIRRMFNHCLQQAFIPLTGKDILFIAKKAVQEYTQENLCQELKKTIGQKKSII